MPTDQSGSTYLLVCMYLPFFGDSVESSNDYLITLGELEGFIARHRSDHLIAGDFKVDFNLNNVNLGHLMHFLSDLNLTAADLPHHASIQYTYLRDDGTASSWLGHYLCDFSLVCALSNFCRFDLGANLSDHSPLLCSFSVALSSACSSSSSITLLHDTLVLLGMLFLLSFLMFSVL